MNRHLRYRLKCKAARAIGATVWPDLARKVWRRA